MIFGVYCKMNREPSEKIDESSKRIEESVSNDLSLPTTKLDNLSEAPTKPTTITMSIREMYESRKAEMEQFNEQTGRTFTCVLCEQPSKGFGNNPQPICDGKCCDECNYFKVIPARMAVAERDALARRLHQRIEAQRRQRGVRR